MIKSTYRKSKRRKEMCTSIFSRKGTPLFGRNMDVYFELERNIIITPRKHDFSFRFEKGITEHYAIMGMGMIKDGYPLYFDAINEKGVAVAGLDFPGNAFYSPFCEADKINITPFELIPYLLSICSNMDEVLFEIERLNIVDENFSSDMPLSPLHWHIADKKRSVVLESMRDGIKVYENEIGVMTNNPPFGFHLLDLARYGNLNPKNPSHDGWQGDLKPFSFGFGAIGLPGDLSSTSRFVRAAYILKNSVVGDDPISQFFHILDGVAMVRGAVDTEKGGKYDITSYSSCADLEKGIYYYKTYENSRISAAEFSSFALSGTELISRTARKTNDVCFIK